MSLGAVTLVAASNVYRPHLQDRVFGLAANGFDDEAVKRTATTAAALGRRLDALVFYDAFSQQAPLPTALLDRIMALGVMPVLTWEPWNPEGGAAQPLYSAAQIAGGRFDAYVAMWARQVAQDGRRFMLRFGHEMNGDWYPWSVGRSGARPEDYVAAFRRVRRIFDDSGANQVQWVWSPNVIINDDRDAISHCYPGDDYVDVIGIDGYNFGDDGGHRWRTPGDLFGPTIDLVAELAPNKPVWITEVGCADRGGDKASWITDLVSFLESTDVVGLIWFEADKPGEPDWRLTSTRATGDAARAALRGW
ncbi:beta-mannanase [Mycolicibacterium canariasense]|uniref:Beta-mannanase n=1 Tax=Mycolicibacterium canariasense TaxID=228230 RepID=A0A117IBG2_MYCCR|nr:beta-mannanase [Mycolicibacterium canariasense]